MLTDIQHNPTTMKRNNLFVIVAISLISFATATFAQDGTDVSFHAGIPVPTAEFASDNLNNEDAGGAAPGFELGFNLNHPISENGLGVVFGFDVTYNGIKRSVKDDIEDEFSVLGSPDITWWKYFNVPIYAGLSYIYEDNGNLAVFGNLGGVINFFRMTDFIVANNGTEIETSFDSETGFGYKIGGGIKINDEWLVSVDYFDLGQYDLDATMRGPTGTEKVTGVQSVSFVTLTVGFLLK